MGIKIYKYMKCSKEILICIAILLMGVVEITATNTGRGLWACYSSDYKSIFVSWRMRATDHPKNTTYKLFADGNLVATLTDKTNVSLSTNYSRSTFSLEVYDKNGNLIGSESGITCKNDSYYPIALDHPADYRMPDGTTTVYFPYDCSAYDMDGDGEEEIIVNWASDNIGAVATPTAPPLFDCYKLDGRKLWRINCGPNVLNGCRMVFLCYDFDGDGKGEMIVRTAPGAKDATGSFLSKGVAAGANHWASSINSYGVITDGGKEWITCFDGVTGRELATIDYWPYFNIQYDWDDRNGESDGSSYGHRGNWLKGCVAFLDVDGLPTPCAVTNRGIYTYSYAAAYTWNGKELSTLWRHTSERAGQGIYAQGAHSITCGDVDGDGFDEIIVGAACLDHDGKLLWSTGLGHGDATHLGDFDLDNPGLEYFMITEESSAQYDCALLDARTGKVLMSKKQSGGDTGRGLILDCDPNYDGSEIMEFSDANLFSCKGVGIAPWHTGSIKNSSINNNILWDGDLLEESADRGHVDKWNPQSKTWDRVYTFGYNIKINGVKLEWGANTNNATKYNPNLQTDIVGDWREESLFWTVANGTYFLTIYTSTMPTDYKLPWLRDDHLYDMAIAWQNCGYNQPPHLGYNPTEYYRDLAQAAEPTCGRWGSGGARNQTVTVGDEIKTVRFELANCTGFEIVGNLPKGITATTSKISNKSFYLYIGGTPTEQGVFSVEIKSVGGITDVVFPGVTITSLGKKATQTINLSEGWNLISTNVVPDNNSIDAIFANTDVEIVKTDTECWIKSQPEMFNTLTQIQPAVGYMVYAKTASRIEIQGTEFDSQNYSYELHSGWNLVGCPYKVAVSPADVLGKIQIIKTLDGKADMIEPSKAYFVKY